VQGDGVQDDSAQGGHAQCGRSCSAAAAGGSAREQRGRAWRTSEAVEEKAAEDTALMQADHGPRGGGKAVMARRIGRRSYVATRGGRGRSNAARVRRAAQDRRRW
jgi:hypothetical protein